MFIKRIVRKNADAKPWLKAEMRVVAYMYFNNKHLEKAPPKYGC